MSEVSQNLPREVLRWIQSLDLAYSVKNVKRDFSNGFLVAEIFSRYYAKDVQMHSYDNGNAVKAKRDNWNQLLKVFRKLGFPQILSEDEADFILRCEGSAAIDFITKCYELLTSRRVQTQVKKPTLGREPGYAKETGTWKIREAIRKYDLSEDSDMLSATKKTTSALADHERNLQDERSIDPDRFSVATQSIGVRSTQMAPKTMEESNRDMPQVRVKEIQVKQLDRNVTHLRASKQMSNDGPGSNRSLPRISTPKLDGHGSISERIQNQSGAMLPENSMSVINACISRVLGPDNFVSWSIDLEPYQNLISAVEQQRSGGSALDTIVAETLGEIRMSSQEIAEACAVTPKQFWRVSDLLCAITCAAAHSTSSFEAVVDCFEAIGRWTTLREPRASLSLFCDFSLFKLSNALTSHPHKRLGILRVLLCWRSLGHRTQERTWRTRPSKPLPAQQSRSSELC